MIINLPEKIRSILYGNRSLYGTKIIKNDLDWIKWQKLYSEIYYENQKKGIGKIINNMGYNILKDINFKNKTLLEIGIGSLPYLKKIGQSYKWFYAIDTNKEFLKLAKKNMSRCSTIHDRNGDMKNIPLKDNSIDIVLSFYSLEHIYNLDLKLKEFKRVLKKDGIIVGAIPTEGGTLWGLGRLLTTKPNVESKGINYDKIICWEHPHFASEIILKLEKEFTRKKIIYNPFKFIKFLDLNLVYSFVYKCNK